MTGIDWTTAHFELTLMLPGAETDERVDAWVMAALQSRSSDAVETGALIKALEIADHAIVKQRVAFAIATLASDEDHRASDALVTALKANSDDEFLYVEIFKALGLLAKRNIYAEPDVLSILYRLNGTESTYLLIAAAKIVGQLVTTQDHPKLRKKLAEMNQVDDLDVQAEAFYQQALITFADAMLANTLKNLDEQLQAARLFFKRAEACAEQREDAAAYGLLLDLILEYFHLNDSSRSEVSIRIHEKKVALVALVNNAYVQSWYGYRTQTEQMLMLRIMQVADLFDRIVLSINQVDEWTNFDEALVELAAIYALLLHRDEQNLGRLDSILTVLTPQLVAPRLGSIVMRSIQQVRFEKVIERYIAAQGNDEIAQGLRAIYTEGLRSAQVSQNFSSEALAKIAAAAEQLGEEPDFFLKGIAEAVESGQISEWGKRYNFPSLPLAIDNPHLLGNDPQVDMTARMLLNTIRDQIHPYPAQQWHRLTQVCVNLIQIVQQIRDDLPLYTLAAHEMKKEQPGKGQQATEDDLQKDVFDRLRLCYGRSAGYEITGIGGGRSDSGLKFQECEFPIEVKAEYRTIDRQHIHDHYIAQVDTYAAMRDHIAFLLVLDLRSIHAGGSSPKAPRRSPEESSQPVIAKHALYSLQESFWVDQLPVDPQIENAKHNAVMIGLVPGNRSKPSSMTKYSRKPAAK
ncbi:MAG: hypothetical protein J0L70_06860 [Leptolyngbya sp. UWPOB_LEPTO1]|uniref:hypothetical protein n=1 Tax=Leptolyngbya sp. UWPOB_LEPTO1 TaxID=2815653 RepID=UPI001AD288DB|nr:hypothetical protein [Leptolyngbya sp. UWPOB_LEPTO1]MBN8560223.1 hypothetical protein [Leptolyngbya sp. UWPOB_LEPTO1]